MNLSQIKKIIVDISGAAAVGVAPARPVDEAADTLYHTWLIDGRHGEMSYLERYGDIRRDPRLLLEGTRTIIMAAFSYANPEAVATMRKNESPQIAEYALGQDYHTVVRERLEKGASRLRETDGGTTRVCVDTAPLRERYWAQQSGIGFIGTNNYLILPGLGSHFYLGALLWTEVPEDGFDSPCNMTCGNCGACVKACPAHALSQEGRIDARKCLSYLTIESRQPLPPDTPLGKRLFGCDTCRNVCPHQPSDPPLTNIPEFVARPEIVRLSRHDWETMTSEQFNRMFRNSALRRTKLPRILDNLKRTL